MLRLVLTGYHQPKTVSHILKYGRKMYVIICITASYDDGMIVAKQIAGIGYEGGTPEREE